MNKPLDPMSVERKETPSASYVLRRRYGRARPVITVASWVTVINLLFQPVAVLAASYSSTQTGNYNANATWGGAANPGGGTVSDTVSVNGTHAVTVTLANDASTDTVTVNSGGTLEATVVNALKDGTVVLNGGTLRPTFAWAGGSLNFGGTIQVSANSVVDVNNTDTGNAQTAVFGALSFTAANKTLEFTSPYSSGFGNYAQFTSLTLGANSGQIKTTSGHAVVGAITANSGTTLTKTGSGTLYLNGAATWTGAGGVIANGGTVVYNFADSLGTTTGNQINNTAVGIANVANSIRGATVQVNAGGTLSPAIVADALNGATIVLNGGNLTATFGWVNYNIIYGGAIQVSDNSTITVTDTYTSNQQFGWFGGLSFTAANKTLQLSTGNATTLGTAFTSLAVNTDSTLYVNSTGSAYNVVISGPTTGGSGAVLIKTGANSLSLNGDNSAYAGALKVSAGTLTTAGNMPSATAIVNGGTFTPGSGTTLKAFVYNSGTFTSPASALTLATAANGGYIGGTGAITLTMLGKLTNNGSGVYGGDPTGAWGTTGAGKLGTLTITPAHTLSNDGTFYVNVDRVSGSLTSSTAAFSTSLALPTGSNKVYLTAYVNTGADPANGEVVTFATGTINNFNAANWNVLALPASAAVSPTVNWTGNASDNAWPSGNNWDLVTYGTSGVTLDGTSLKLTFNGSSGNIAPVSTSDVMISTGSPTVTGPTTATVIKSFTLGNGSTTPSLTLQTGGALTVSGAVTVNAGATLTATSAALTAPSLTLNGGNATLGNASGNITTGTVTAGTLTVNAGTVGTVNLSGTGSLAGSSAVNQVNVTGGTPTFSGNATIMTVTGGNTTIGSGAKVATADLSAAGTGTVNAANPLTITDTLKLSGGITAKLTGGATSFTVSNPAGGNIVTDTGRTFTLSGGKLTFVVATIPTGAAIRYDFESVSGTTVTNGGDTGATYDGTLIANGGAGTLPTVVAVTGHTGASTSVLNTTTANAQGVRVGSNSASGWTPTTSGVYTMSMWFQGILGTDYRTSFKGRADTDNIMYIQNNDDTANMTAYMTGFPTVTNPFSMQPYRIGQAQGSSWHMLTFVANGSTTKIYMDGVDTTSSMNTTFGTNPLGLIGCGLSYTGGNRNFAQYIDDVYIYNKELSAAEVGNLYNPPAGLINFPNTAIAATATSILDLGAGAHTLGNVTVTAGASENTTLIVNNVTSLTIGTLTIGINGEHYGQLNLNDKTLALTSLAVTSTSPTVTKCCVAVAAAGSFSTGLNGTQLTDNTGKKWNVEVRAADGTTVDANGPQLWLVAASGGTAILFK